MIPAISLVRHMIAEKSHFLAVQIMERDPAAILQFSSYPSHVRFAKGREVPIGAGIRRIKKETECLKERHIMALRGRVECTSNTSCRSEVSFLYRYSLCEEYRYVRAGIKVQWVFEYGEWRFQTIGIQMIYAPDSDCILVPGSVPHFLFGPHLIPLDQIICLRVVGGTLLSYLSSREKPMSARADGNEILMDVPGLMPVHDGAVNLSFVHAVTKRGLLLANSLCLRMNPLEEKVIRDLMPGVLSA